MIAMTAIPYASELQASVQSPEEQAAAALKAMTPEEKTILTYGIMPLPFGNNPPAVPADAIPGAGYVHGIPRLGIPSLKETDASLGVAYVSGQRNDWATALPSGVAMASTWNPELIRTGGAMIGSEARAKGFNVMLAGGINLMRDPRNGRTFEYFSEDPLLSGVLVGNAISGIQSNHIISTIKHLAFNGQETGRHFADVKISDAAARESDLLAFEIGIEIGNPGAVMCAYNRVNGKQACDSDYLLNKALKHDWRYKGFVMSDWGAVPNLGAALNGLDQQSGAQLDPEIFFKDPLAAAVKSDPRFAARLDDMNRRVLWAIYTNGVDTHPVMPGGKIDFAANASIAEETAKQGLVLLRNARGVLPLARTTKRIAVIGGYANAGVMSGAGSSQVHGEGGPSVLVPTGPKDMQFANFLSQQYHNSVPLTAIRKMVPAATVTYHDGAYIAEAVTQAKRADVVIVFATKWSTEGLDQTGPVAAEWAGCADRSRRDANPNTIVVLETGNPVLMPWLGKTAAVLRPGIRAHAERRRLRRSCSVTPIPPADCRSRSLPARPTCRAQGRRDGLDRAVIHRCGADPGCEADRLITILKDRISAIDGMPARAQGAVSLRLWSELHAIRSLRTVDKWHDRELHCQEYWRSGRRHRRAAVLDGDAGRQAAAPGCFSARTAKSRRKPRSDNVH